MNWIDYAKLALDVGLRVIESIADDDDGDAKERMRELERLLGPELSSRAKVASAIQRGRAKVEAP